MRRMFSGIALCTVVVLASSTNQALAAPDPTKPIPAGAVQADKPAAPPVEPPVVDAGKRQDLLGRGWQSSGDRLWTTIGDATGFHVLVAEAKTGYSWRTVATLGQGGVETDKWIGNACVTGSGEKAVVVYAPRTATNKEELFSRGGSTAVVDLASGVVTKLPVHTTLAYFNPGCGAGESVALTQGGDVDLGRTALMTVDASTGKLSERTELTGQFTSAVPVRDGFAVAGGTGVLKIGRDGKKERLSKTSTTPFHLKADADGGVVYLANESGGVALQRATDVGGPVATLATGALGAFDVTTGKAGKVFITGTPAKVEALPRSVRKVDAPAGAAVSSDGEAAITELRPSGSPMKAEPQAWHVRGKSLKTGRDLGFTVNAADALTPREVEPDHTCAVPRNDPEVQVLQPKPKQVEWAVDMAVLGFLGIRRPAGWNHNGLAVSYVPQQLFPLTQLSGGGHVPPQVMLGIIGQESNMWQASRYVLPGEYGNPLIGNYYGVDVYDANQANDWDVNFAKADCGYGVTQMTDGMRRPGFPRDGETLLDNTRQVAIGTDYAANVAAGLQLLSTKWNVLQSAGIKLHDGDPSNIENWFFAAWAYNSGYHPPGENNSNGASGLGWGNNPANPRYDPNRGSFGENPADFARPQNWPYPEKVMGFAANTPWGFENENTEVPFFRAAVWNGGDGSASTPGTGANNRRNVKPDRFTFCNGNNNCEPGARYTPTDPEVDDDPAADTGPCAHKNVAGQYDLKCWWHTSASWKADNCALTCGYEYIRYDYPEFAAEPDNGNSFPPTCNSIEESGLPSSRSLVVEHRSLSLRGCTPWRTSGTMTFQTDGKPAGWADLHQIGSGAGGHFWISTTKSATSTDAAASVRAEWQVTQKLRTKAQVYAFIPAHSSRKATKAVYKIETARGVREVEIDQTPWKNQWMPLGTFDFDNNPKVTLSTITSNGSLGEVMAFDALAFSPVTGTQGDPTKERITRIFSGTTGKCLAPANTWSTPVAVVQAPCLNNDLNFSDDWIVRVAKQYIKERPGQTPVVYSAYHFVHRATGSCLAVAGDSTAQGAAAELRTCDDSTRILWNGVNSLLKYEQDVVITPMTDLALHPLGNSGADGVQIVQGTAPDSGDPARPFFEFRI